MDARTSDADAQRRVAAVHFGCEKSSPDGRGLNAAGFVGDVGYNVRVIFAREGVKVARAAHLTCIV